MARPATGTVVEKQTKQGTSYALRFRANGQRQYVTLGGSWDGWNRDRADTELANVLADVRRGTWKPAEAAPTIADTNPTFHEFATEWYAGHKLGLRPRTAEDYLWALSHHLLPFFKDHRLSQITVREVDRYRTTKLAEGVLAAGTLNKTITRLAQILDVAVEYELIDANPARGRRRRAKADAPRRLWLEPEQVQPLIDAASVRGQRGGKTSPDPRMRAMLCTLVCAGLRIGELLALRWADVDFANGRIRVGQAKTDAGVREVLMWGELHDELMAYKLSLGALPRHQAFVFGTSTGRPDTRQNVRKRLRRAVTRANALIDPDTHPPLPVDLTPHSLRRTFASLLYERGEDPTFVMDQLGHTDPKLALRIYAKSIARRKTRGAGLRLVGVLNGARWATGATDTAYVPDTTTTEAAR